MIIKTQATDKVLSSYAGLLPAQDLMKKFQLESSLSPVLPTLKSGVSRSLQKFTNLVLGLQVGANCIDDMHPLNQDCGFTALCADVTYSPKSYGDFLRSFSAYQCKLLNQNLIQLAYDMRQKHLPSSDSITIDIDSTTIKQYGKKMQGVRKHRNGFLCLDTITACDELGFQYWHDVRKGNTHTSVGSKEMIHEIFHNMPKTEYYKGIRKYVRADSGYCQTEFFNACAAKNALFVVRLRSDMLQPLIPQISNWKEQNPKKENRILFYDGRECEIGSTYHTRKDCPSILRIVVIRALKSDLKQQSYLLDHEDNYDYFAWISTIGEYEMSNEKLIRFYQKRGQMENCIREMKNGFDLKHYPCLKLTANKAYGLAAAFAYNFMRFLALLSNTKKPPYAKQLRLRLIHKPAQIVRHARGVVFRYMDHHHKEIEHWLDKISQIQLGFTT